MSKEKTIVIDVRFEGPYDVMISRIEETLKIIKENRNVQYKGRLTVKIIGTRGIGGRRKDS